MHDVSVVASSLAVLVWFSLYKFVYQQDFSPGLPGQGPFQVLYYRAKTFKTEVVQLEWRGRNLK
jgi:hypothetical protein